MTRQGTLASAHIYPLKGGRAVDLDRALVEPWGLAGDRRWLLVDADCQFMSQRKHPALARLIVGYHGRPGDITVAGDGHPPLTVPAPDDCAELLKVTVWRSTVLASAAGPEADAWFTKFVGEPARLVWLDDPTRRAVDPEYGRDGDTVSFADGYPLLLTSAGSLDQLNQWLAAAGDGPVPMNRFRPNVVVAGYPPWSEDDWRRIRIGPVEFRVPKPCGRCVVTTTDQATGERGGQPLKMLAARRRFGQNLVFGQNLIPDSPGVIHVGDPVEIILFRCNIIRSRLNIRAIVPGQSARDNELKEQSKSPKIPRRKDRQMAVAPVKDAPAKTGLRTGALGFPALLAQSVALISPTMTAVLIIPLAFSSAGQGTWLAYLFGTVMLLFVVLCLNQFTKRSAAPGAMYTYTARGLGPATGVISGWTLLWCYLFIGTAGLTGFAIFCQQFLDALGATVTVPPDVFFVLSAVTCWYIAYKDIRISSLITLAFEGISVALILALAAVVLFKHGFTVDTSQLKLAGVTPHGMSLAVVACIFSLVGFESATALSGEARNPLRTVPRAVIWSLIITGAFMVVMGYVEVFGTRHYGTPLSAITAPLTVLSSLYQVTFFKAPIALGAMISFFSLSLSCLNAGARILYPMGEHQVFPHQLGRAHGKNGTPHVALTVYIAIMLAIPVVLELFTNPVTTFGDAGTLAAFGFLLAYFLITIAAPVYLRRRGELRARHVVIAVIACLALLVPTEGSFYPVPPFPVNIFPYLFAAYIAVGGGWLFLLSRRRPGILAEIESDLDASIDVHEQRA